MERINRLGNSEPIKEFYFIYHGDGSRNLVSAIGKQGGYVYFLIESKGKISEKNFDPIISPISNILDYCGSPDSQVIAIDPRDPQNRNICKILSDSIDAFSMQTTNKSLE